jgi:DNA-binding transcriptional regulator YhcF (GntR family)
VINDWKNDRKIKICDSMMSQIRVNREWPLAPSEQLKAELRTAIWSGDLRPGSRLPKVKDMAAEVGVNANTVASAYRGLAREGLLTARRRGGTQVAPGPFLQSPGDVAAMEAADGLVAVARRFSLGGADLIRLVAGRWGAVPGASPVPAERGVRVYDFLRSREHDQG